MANQKPAHLKETVDLPELAVHHRDSEDALRLYFSASAPVYQTRFSGYRPDEVMSELQRRLTELDKTSTLTVLAAVEATFRIDYLQRCIRREKDAVSVELRKNYKKKAYRVSLEDEIFQVWKDQTAGSRKLISDLKSAFKFRHWLAHGRYWTPKLGRTFDFLTVYTLAQSVLESFPLLGL